MLLELSWEAVTGLYAVHFLARRSAPVPAADIARHGGLSTASLAKVLQRLRRQGIVRSERGRGFSLARPADRISVLDIVRAIEGRIGRENHCLMKASACSLRENCPLSLMCRELSMSVTTALDGIRVALLPVAVSGLPVCMDRPGRKETLPHAGVANGDRVLE